MEKKNVEDSVQDGLIITATTTGIFYVLKAANAKPPKASLDAMEQWVVSLSKTMQSAKNGSTSETTTKFYGPQGK